MSTEKVREQIARILVVAEHNLDRRTDIYTWGDVADQILAIPEVLVKAEDVKVEPEELV